MVDPIGTSLSALATADLCIKYGKTLLAKYRAFKNAERDISELTLRLDNHWIKFEYEITVLKDVWPSLGERLQVHQNALLHTLSIKLQESIDLLDSTIGTPNGNASVGSLIEKKGHIRRGQYALSLHDCLEKSMNELEKWHKLFDPSWFLMTLVPGQNIDQQLTNQRAEASSSISTLKSLRKALRAANENSTSGPATSIWLPSNFISEKRTRIPSSTVQLAEGQDVTATLLVDTIALDPQSQVVTTMKDIRNLARVLSKSDPLLFGLLRCCGVLKVPQSVRDVRKFEFVYSIPKDLKEPTSLRTLLATNEDAYSLNERLGLAQSLANSVMYVHSSQFVHKNIRPETTIIFRNDMSKIAAAFLVGFEKFRLAEGQTLRQGDFSWEKDLYRHPSRQGLRPEEDYVMQHDIYSLGVSLLEIGLWTSFVAQGSSPDIFTPGLALDINGFLAEKNQRKKAAEIKRTLVDMASNRLPNKMGWKYTNIVLSCLKCLDKANNGFGNEDQFMDEDSILVGVRYIETVLVRMQEISV